MVSKAPNSKLSPNRSRDSLSSKAYESLAERLLDRRLVPGMLLNRREIAHDLNMSVAPVLEAILQLESEGFLESVPRKGTLVRAVRIEDLKGQLILREALECEAARYYCGEPIVRNRKKLEELAKAIDSIDRSARDEQWRAEYAFHLALIQSAGIPALESAYRKVMRQKLFMALNLYMSAHNVSSPRDNHARLLKKLESVEPDEAESIIRTHLHRDTEELFQRPA